jgi:hypothetical protein
MAARFSHAYLVTGDIGAMRSLLVDALGLEVLLEEDGYLRVGGHGGFHVGIEEGAPGPPGSLELAIEVDDAMRRIRAPSRPGFASTAPRATRSGVPATLGSSIRTVDGCRSGNPLRGSGPGR